MKTTTRRTFLMTAPATGAAMAAPSPSARVNVASIGLRGRGGSLMNHFAEQEDFRVVRLCDIDRKVLGSRAAFLEKRTGRKLKTGKDYREVLDDKEANGFLGRTYRKGFELPTI